MTFLSTLIGELVSLGFPNNKFSRSMNAFIIISIIIATINNLKVYMWWFNFILGFHFVYLRFKLIIIQSPSIIIQSPYITIHCQNQKQREIKFKQRITLKHKKVFHLQRVISKESVLTKRRYASAETV